MPPPALKKPQSTVKTVSDRPPGVKQHFDNTTKGFGNLLWFSENCCDNPSKMRNLGGVSWPSC